MIKFDKKKVVIKGNQNDLIAQWTFIGNAIYKSMKAQIGEETAEKLMRRCAENVFKSEKTNCGRNIGNSQKKTGKRKRGI